MGLFVNSVASLASTLNVESYATVGSFTPTENSLLVAFVNATSTASEGAMTGGGLTWTRQTRLPYSVHSAYLFTALVGNAPADTHPTFDCTGDAATGCIIGVSEWTGVDLSNPIRQLAETANDVGVTSSTISFSMPVLNTNGYVAALGLPSGAPGITQPTDWELLTSQSIATPVHNQTTAFRIYGETGTDFTFTHNLALSALIGIEILEGGGAMQMGKYWGVPI